MGSSRDLFRCPDFRSSAPGPEGEQAIGAQDLKDLEQVQCCPPLHPSPEAITWASPDRCRAGRVGSVVLPSAICDSPFPSLRWFPDSPLPTWGETRRDLERNNPTTSWAQDHSQTLDNLPKVRPPNLYASSFPDLTLNTEY